jgi:hypothetical protein
MSPTGALLINNLLASCLLEQLTILARSFRHPGAIRAKARHLVLVSGIGFYGGRAVITGLSVIGIPIEVCSWVGTCLLGNQRICVPLVTVGDGVGTLP